MSRSYSQPQHEDESSFLSSWESEYSGSFVFVFFEGFNCCVMLACCKAELRLWYRGVLSGSFPSLSWGKREAALCIAAGLVSGETMAVFGMKY